MAQGRKYVSYSRQQAMRNEGEEGKEAERDGGNKRKEVDGNRESSNPFSSANGSFNPLNQPRPPRNPINNSFNPLNQPRPPRNPTNNAFNPSNQPRPPRNPINNAFNPSNQPRPPREPRPHITPLNTLFQASFSAQQRSPQAPKLNNSTNSYSSRGITPQAIPRPNLENPTPRQCIPSPILQNQYRNTEHTRFNSTSAFQTSPSSSNPISLFTSSSTKSTTKGNSLLGLAAGLQQQYFKTSKFAVCLK